MAPDHSSRADVLAMSASTGPQISEQPDTAHKFVSFFIGETHYAISAKAVSEVTAQLTPTPLPDCPPSLLGVTPHRGDILAVVQPIEAHGSSASSRKKTIILRPVGDRVEIPVAFTVDRIGEVVQFAPADIKAASNSDPMADFEGVFNGNSIRLVDPARIADLVSL